MPGASSGRALPMRDLIVEILSGLGLPFSFGQILVQKLDRSAFVLSHRDDASLDRLQTYRDAKDAIEIAKHDDAGNYRPLKTAPNLRHGWRLEVADRSLDFSIDNQGRIHDCLRVVSELADPTSAARATGA